MTYLRSRLFVYFTFWSIFFFLGQIQRAVLLFLFSDQSKEIPILVIAESFLVGGRFDASIAAYCTIPFFLVSFIWHFLKLKFEKTFLLLYFIFFSSIYIFLLVAEIEYFSHFNHRFTSYIWQLQGDITFVLSMIWESYPVLLYFFLIFIFVVFLTLLFNRFIKKSLLLTSNPFKLLILLIVSGLFLFVSARGTLDYNSPLRWGYAFFSSYSFSNKLALSGIFSLATDLVAKKENLQELFEEVNTGYFSNSKEAFISTLKYIDPKTKFSKNYKTGFERNFSLSKKKKKYNVILIIGETFANYYVKKFNGKDGIFDIAPNFRKLKKDGYFFKNYFANGYRTNIGLFSSLSGMPHNYGRPMMKRTEGQFSRVSLAKILKKENYHTLFMVPHDPHFDNLGAYLKNNGYDQIITSFDFPKKAQISTWGVPDHFIFNSAISEIKKLNKKNKPFLITILTSTNHSPFATPKAKGYNPIGKEKTIFRSFHYMDWAIDQFLKKSEKLDAFKNTIFVITGDHGTSIDARGHDFHFSLVNLPLLFYAPKIIKSGSSEVYSYQADLMPSILHWLGISYKADIFGRNLFQKQKSNYAFFQEDKTLGFIENDWYLIDRIGAKSSLFNLKAKNPFLDIASKNTLLLDQMKKKVRGIFFSTNEVLLSKKNIFQ